METKPASLPRIIMMLLLTAICKMQASQKSGNSGNDARSQLWFSGFLFSASTMHVKEFVLPVERLGIVTHSVILILCKCTYIEYKPESPRYRLHFYLLGKGGYVFGGVG